MALTRGQLITRISTKLERPGDTAFETLIAGDLDQMLFFLFDMHDWEWKHKEGTFNTVSGTESYNISVSSPYIRSVQDIDVLWDSTNKVWLNKVNLKDIRKAYPGGSGSGIPIRYAPWGAKWINLDNIPNSINVMKYLYLSKAVLPTADGNDLESTCGVPDYCHYLLEKLVLAEAMQIDNDDRRDNLLIEIERMWKPKAINADMKHLESNSRFKFWEEEVQSSGSSYDDFLRHTWWGED